MNNSARLDIYKVHFETADVRPKVVTHLAYYGATNLLNIYTTEDHQQQLNVFIREYSKEAALKKSTDEFVALLIKRGIFAGVNEEPDNIFNMVKDELLAIAEPKIEFERIA